MEKINVGIFYGGVSTEHEVSRRSAVHILNSLDAVKFNPVLFEITKGGRLIVCDASDVDMQDCCRLILEDQVRTKGVSVPYSEELFENFDIDVVFPVIHGTGGEDGVLQGFFETCDIAYVGSGVLSSALGFDKAFAKIILKDRGIPQAGYVCLDMDRTGDFSGLDEKIGNKLGYPVFVKPANGGSSVGIYKVKSPGDLNSALKKAFRYDRKIIVEEEIKGRELECAVIGGYEKAQALGVGEVIPCNEFYDYKAKYIDEGSRTVIPAPVGQSVTDRVMAMAVEAFEALDCFGLARVDFFLDEANNIYLNEINTMPGFTSISMYPKLWKAGNGDDMGLVTELIRLAMERKKRYSFLREYQGEESDE